MVVRFRKRCRLQDLNFVTPRAQFGVHVCVFVSHLDSGSMKSSTAIVRCGNARMRRNSPVWGRSARVS